MDIEQIQKLLNVSSNIKWSKHCLERMHPSCLIFGHTKENKVLHIVVGSDNSSLFFITAYFPNIDKFEEDLKTRKGQ